MKKLFFYMVAAAIALTSCSSEDVVEVNNNGNAIDFRVAMGPGANSRGLETTKDNLKEFYATAILNDGDNYFQDELFSHKSDGHFECDAKDLFWPMNENVLDFYAYSYYTDGDLEDDLENGILGKVTITSEKQELAGFAPNTNIVDQIDLVTAKKLGCKRETDISTVSLTFNHALSQIMVRARNDKDYYTYEVAGVKIVDVISKGTFNMNTEEWSFDATPEKANYIIEYEDAITVGNGDGEEATDIMSTEVNGTAMLIPQDLTNASWNHKVGNESSGAYLAVKLKVTMTELGTQVYPKTGDYAWVVIPINTHWLPKKKYVYILNFTTGAGYDEQTGEKVFDGEVSCSAIVKDWEEDKDKNADYGFPVKI